MIQLAKELEAAGYVKDEEAFRETLADQFNGLYRSWTDEDLLCSPRDALEFWKFFL
jgi:hypothetical protein